MDRRTTMWTDFAGTNQMGTLRTSAGAGSVQSQLALLSNAAPVEFWEGTDVFTGLTPVNGQFPNIADFANLLYSTAAGNLVAVRLFAPKAAIFKPDLMTVDPTAIAALTTAVLANVLDANGNAVTSYVGGTRQRANRDY